MLRVANAQGFWGDDADAPARTVAGAEIDVLTLDYCAEVSMSILARQKQKDANLGYARDFLDTLRSLVPYLKQGGKIVTNAGGLNPRACAQAATKLLVECGATGIRIGIVEGDDVLSIVRSTPADFDHLESRRPISDVLDRVLTANAYIGALPVAQALRAGAQIVIAGRLADPSMVVAPAMAHFDWADDDWDRLAGASVAGHLVECGAQATGGIATHWINVPGNDNIGFPIVEIDADGSCVLTKPAGTGGEVTDRTAKEQLLYEMGDPGNFLTPDVTASILSVKIDDLGLRLHRQGRAFGTMLLALAPRLMRFLSVVGTLAMFTVGGGIIAHGWHAADVVLEGLAHRTGVVAPVTKAVLDAFLGVLAGAVLVGVMQLVGKLRRKPA